MSHRHAAILQWLLANPHRSLGECATTFKVTQPWLTQIIHSDMFQARLREESAKIGQAVYQSITSKLHSVAALSLERQVERLEKPGASDRLVVDAGRTALQALGYLQPSSPSVQQHLHLHASVDADLVLKARERIAQAASLNPPPQKIIDSVASPGASPDSGAITKS